VPLHPVLWVICSRAARARRPSASSSTAERRASALAAARARPAPVDGLLVSDHDVPVDGGSIAVRMYRPPGDGPLPAHLFFHSGDFWSGGILEAEPIARRYAVAAGCAVLSVGYRLAPEHPWPAAPEDGYAALRWAAASAADLGVDARRISVGGVSAGGAVAAVVALLARDRSGPPIVLQLLEIPVTDLTMSTSSMVRFGSRYVVTRAALAEGYEYYVPDAGLRTHPYASPLFAEQLSGLPPAMILTCEYDPLRDEGEAYAARLRAAGVPAQLVRARGHIHGSTYFSAWYLRSGRRYQAITASALREAYR
jgi:acetyl esterase